MQILPEFTGIHDTSEGIEELASCKASLCLFERSYKSEDSWELEINAYLSRERIYTSQAHLSGSSSYIQTHKC